MAASVTSFNFPLKPTDPFVTIMVHPNPNPNEPRSRTKHPAAKSTRLLMSHGPTSTIFLTRPSRTRFRSSTEIRLRQSRTANPRRTLKTDSEDELPIIDELLRRRPAPKQEEQAGAAPAAEGLIGDTRTPAAVSHGDGGSGGDADGDARRSSQPSEGEAGAEERGEAVMNSGSAEHGDGSGDDDDGNNNSATGPTCYPPSRGSALAPCPAMRQPPSVEHPNLTLMSLLRVYMRQSGSDSGHTFRTGEGDESMSMRAPTPNPIPPPASQAATAEGRSRMDNERRGAEYNGEAVVATSDREDGGCWRRRW
ncbi:uncharacterized protein BDZ99DRAFT_527098 [Mytilinidion resinicola]|uniref:Uncharacterized protein n=1 Tax=Mytilinidion resinicola TaxID=574789 RepID=A0A6A6Y2Z2_9PEZI|nr:uncharacterized protein BDZ99DRAFT_527098 [Mytilinidion resinicola]KAF2803009.1 hypothetical protein BDZ99DRAFT_527098 [Mytilinidion resinicola]